MKTAIVTGSHGFIGSQLCKRLNELDYYVIPVDLKIDRDARDIEDYITDDVAVVYHLAATPSVFNTDIDKSIDNNIRAFINVCNACKKRHIRLVYASSSCALTANCTSLYGITKKMNEEYTRCYNKEAVGLRFYNVYGNNPREGTLLYNLINKHCIIYSSGMQHRHFTYIDDVIDCLVKAIDAPAGLYTVANDEYITVKEFINKLSRYVDVDVKYTDEERLYDKTQQYIDYCEAPRFKQSYVTIDDALYKIFTINNLCD